MISLSFKPSIIQQTPKELAEQYHHDSLDLPVLILTFFFFSFHVHEAAHYSSTLFFVRGKVWLKDVIKRHLGIYNSCRQRRIFNKEKALRLNSSN